MWEPTPGATADDAAGELAAASRDLRPNQLLDSFFAEASAPARSTAAGDPRHNPDLDAAFGLPAAPPVTTTAVAGGAAAQAARDVPRFDLSGSSGSLFPGLPTPTRVTSRPAAATPTPAGQTTPTIGDPSKPYGFFSGAFAGAQRPGADGGNPQSGGGVNPAEVPRLVKEIRDAVVKMAQASASAGPATGKPHDPTRPPAPGGEGYGLRDAVRPITDRLGNSRVGQIARKAWSRLPKGMRDKATLGEHPADAA